MVPRGGSEGSAAFISLETWHLETSTLRTRRWTSVLVRFSKGLFHWLQHHFIKQSLYFSNIMEATAVVVDISSEVFLKVLKSSAPPPQKKGKLGVKEFVTLPLLTKSTI